MKNLNLLDVSVKDLGITSLKTDIKVAYASNETDSTNELFLCSSDLTVKNIVNSKVQWSKELTDIVSLNNSVVSLTHLSLQNSLCVTFSNGEIVTISDNGNKCEVAGFCDSGLLATSWSPDQELLVLVTNEMNAILMFYTFDPIKEVNLLNEQFGEKQFITVGWGKKETQFHGSEGKQARVKQEVKSDPLSEVDDSVKITWRGDGNLYAIGYKKDGIRRFKVFDREGLLQCTNEKQQGLESNIAWRPSGNVIATTQRTADTYDVAFFEKNGLKHGGFSIPLNAKTCEVKDLAWSSDSEILALLCDEKYSDTSAKKLLLFTSSNYHWYLKQTLHFHSHQQIQYFSWNSDFEISNNKKLQLILENGQEYVYTWAWDYNHTKGKSARDDSVIATIDGNKLLVTGFRQTVVPPPMAALEINADTFINSVHFAPIHDVEDTFVDSNSFFICTADDHLIFYNQSEKFPLKYKKMKTVKLQKCCFPFQYYHWVWLNNNKFVCASADFNGNYFLIEWHLEGDSLIKTVELKLPVAVFKIQAHPTDMKCVFIQLENGEILQYTLNGGIEPQGLSFNVVCPKFDIISLENQLYFVGLSFKGNLYLNDNKIMSNVSSYFVHTHFLLLTTLQHVLLCVKLTDLGITSISDYERNENSYVYKRKIERGAKLVLAVPNDTRTIFQMPRGNLEVIQPRPLSLKIIGEMLDDLKYHEAFNLMRKQRINLNLIYDHNPELFKTHIDTFLESITSNSWLNLFLSELDNSDVTKTMYASTYNDVKRDKESTENKIKSVCDMMREHLVKRMDKDHRVLPIIMTFVKMNRNEDLENALSVIKDLKLLELKNSKLPVGSDEALKFLLYMVDVNQLFDVALGMYDFDLVLLVANKSQKDPKEYVPLLNELNAMDEYYKKFTINKNLKRFKRAVHNLAKCGQEKYDELKAFVKFHSLYRDALELFPQNDEIYKQISDDFGSYLRLKKHYVEAGIVYEKAGYNDKAIGCYRDALEWELALKLALVWPKDQFKKLCWELSSSLKEEKRYEEASRILELYCDDIDEVIANSIENKQYKTALRLCTKHAKDWKGTQLLEVIMDDCKTMNDLIENNWVTFVKHKERLWVVRENKSKNPVEMYEVSCHKDSDLYSDAGSTLASSQSRSSSRTFRSSKNRRKHERKLTSLKEGSQYEDVALIVALYNLIVNSFDMRGQVKDLLATLCWCGKEREAFSLQSSLERLLKEMKDHFQKIWSYEFMLEATNASIAAQQALEVGAASPQGIAGLDSHMRVAPIIQEVRWKLEGLSDL